MQLPNAEHAIIPPDKLRDYLLNSEHRSNGGKAQVFAALGYRRDEWQQLQSDLRTQHLTQDAIEERPREYGRMFRIVAQLQGPVSGRTIRSVWTIRHGEDVPRLITAYPN